MSRQLQQDILADNIANINTPSYKKRDITFATLHDSLIHSVSGHKVEPIGVMPHGSQVLETHIDYGMGALFETNSSYDFAILGEGFFIVETPEGDMYTRKGSFRIDSEGYLVTHDGYRVIGYYDDYIHVENEELDQAFAIANPPVESLIRAGEDLYKITDPSLENVVENPQLKRGYLEGSNVDLGQSMAELIEAFRLFQLNQRILLTQDELLKKSANEIGSLR
ncbi:MAG: flagellar hook-basal body protein [Clostridia bacterium]|nr:flagellar hook-basal body protein [Clostridia bacterium]